MPDVTAEGFLHIIFDTFVFGESLFYFFPCLCVMLYSELEVIAKDCLKNGQPRQFKANTGLHVCFINQNQHFGTVCVHEKQCIETNPLYSHCLIREPGLSFMEGGSLMVGLKFLDTAPTQRPSPF